MCVVMKTARLPAGTLRSQRGGGHGELGESVPFLPGKEWLATETRRNTREWLSARLMTMAPHDGSLKARRTRRIKLVDRHCYRVRCYSPYGNCQGDSRPRRYSGGDLHIELIQADVAGDETREDR